jgi:hypothetical protein
MWTYLGLGTVQGHVSQYHRTTGRFNGLVSGTVPFVIRNEPANPFGGLFQSFIWREADNRSRRLLVSRVCAAFLPEMVNR